VPKVSEEHRAARREEILAAARRCFARHGYEGATVARLERETGLSRGAITNYFPHKEDLFFALAERDAQVFGDLWLGGGFARVCRHILESDPDWIGVYFEAARRLRTDAAFRQRWSNRAPEFEQELERSLRDAQAAGELRADLPFETLARFMGVVADGLASRVSAGYETPDAEALIGLVEDAIRPRAADTRARRRRVSTARP
jgi:TetR/AcrR family transcriptional regulator, transcriptional repressor of aconitase